MDMKKLGLVLSCFGILFSLTRFGITGAAVGTGMFMTYGGFVTVLFLVVGISLIFTSSTLEAILESPEKIPSNDNLSFSDIRGRIGRKIRDRHTSIVLDTSFLISYSDHEEELLDYLSYYSEVIVPQEVLDEIPDGKYREFKNVLKQNTVRPDEGYLDYLEEAKEVLNQGGKPYFRGIISDILDGKEPIPLEGTDEHREYLWMWNNLRGCLEGAGLAETPENLKKEMERHWTVGEADAAVLASAIAKADMDKKVVILEKDKDFEEATRYLGNVYDLNIGYINPYQERL